jgi:hypothetical protein
MFQEHEMLTLEERAEATIRIINEVMQNTD